MLCFMDLVPNCLPLTTVEKVFILEEYQFFFISNRKISVVGMSNAFIGIIFKLEQLDVNKLGSKTISSTTHYRSITFFFKTETPFPTQTDADVLM